METPVSHPTATWKGKRTATVALADSQRKPQGGKKEKTEENKGRKENPGDKYSGLPIPEAITCSEKAFRNLLEQWIKHGVVKPLRARFPITEEMKKSPNFCVYHKYVGHPTIDCYSLRRIYHEKLGTGEIELGQGNSVHDKPLPSHKGKETCSTIVHVDASGSREMVITKNAETPKEMEVPEPGMQVIALMNGVKFRNFFDQIGLSKEARIEATKAIIKAAEAQEMCMTANKSFVKILEQEEGKISFSKADREVKYPHNRPLYVTAIINGMEVRRAFIDNGASVNIMPYSVFKSLGLSDKKLIKEKTSIAGFANHCTRTLGHIRVDMQVGKIRGPVMFHVAEIDAAYHVLLGRAWQNDYGVVPSVFHQCIKTIWKGKEVRVPATKNPFAPEEAHIIEAAFFDDVAEEGENDIAKPDALKLASWEEVQADKFVPEKKEKKKKTNEEQGESSKGKQPMVVDLKKEQGKKELGPDDTRNVIKAKWAENGDKKLAGTKRKEDEKTSWQRVVKPNGKVVFRL